MRFAIGLVALCIVVGTALARSSKEYVKASRLAWSAFECAALASQMDNESEQRRLFQLGYDSAKLFLEAIRDGSVEKQDLTGGVPFAITSRMTGPTIDFMVGTIWEAAIDSALAPVYNEDGKPVASTLWPLYASLEFGEKNCSLL